MKQNILELLKTELFLRLCQSDKITIPEIDAIVAILIKANIDFNLSFSSATRVSLKSVDITIYINPISKLTFSFDVICCGKI